jgi:CelD/BcsL family acetyltransferase involved in cellulose biosynthesis
MHQTTQRFDVAADNSFDFLSDEYAALFAASAATAFQHPIWLDSLYSRLAPACAANRLVITVRDRANGELVMLLPMLRVRRGPIRTIEWADLRVSDYNAPVGRESAFSSLLRDETACRDLKRAIQPFDLLRFPKIPQGAVALEKLLGARPRAMMESSAYSVGLSGSFEQWRSGALDRSYQKELAKKLRQLQKKGELQFCREDASSIASTLEMMKQYRGPRFHTRGDGDLLQRPEYFEFYSDVALRGAGSYSRLYALRMDGRVIAAVLGLCHNGAFLVIMGAFDIEGFKSQSLGALMFEQVAKDCLAQGDIALDFTIGDEPYKKLFGAQPSPMWTVTQTGSAAGALADYALVQWPWVKRTAKRIAEFRLAPATN